MKISRFLLGCLVVLSLFNPLFSQEIPEEKPTLPDHIYIPYKDLEKVLGKQDQGVFLPYKDFQSLWNAARGQPAKVQGSGPAYLVSAARFSGTVEEKLARIELELTVDVLKEDWVTIPVGLGQVGVSSVNLSNSGNEVDASQPLLRFQNDRYEILAKGLGRQKVSIHFVSQLVTQPGRNLLKFNIPQAAINTLELTIPEENLKVDVQPMLAASTTQVDQSDGSKFTKLQAFLGQSGTVSLSWAPKSQAASDLEPVLISSQTQHLRIGEALLQHNVEFNYEIRRRGMKTFKILFPADYRVVSVTGNNLEKWDIEDLQENKEDTPHNRLVVNLFSDVENAYRLNIRMEKFLQDANSAFGLVPIYTEDALRVSGMLGVSHAARRSAELFDLNEELIRVETSRLPKPLSTINGISAYRFNSTNYAASLRTGVVQPRINLQQLWSFRVDQETLHLKGHLRYDIERAGVFSLSMSLPGDWEVDSVQPQNLIDDFEIKGEGHEQTLEITLKKETQGKLHLQLQLRQALDPTTAPVSLNLPLPNSVNLNRFKGQLLLHVSEALNTEIQKVRQLKDLSLRDAIRAYGKGEISSFSGYRNVTAYEFSSVDLDNPVGATFAFDVRPAQVSAEFFRNVDIRPGNVSHEAVLRYQVRYAPVDTFYLKYPAALEDVGLQINGPDLKEKPKIETLPDDQAEPEDKDDATIWVYHKIVLQSPRTGTYDLKVNWRQSFQALATGGDAVTVHPVLAAGKLAGQSGAISVAKAANLAIGTPLMDNLQPADPSSPQDVAYSPHRKDAVQAFRSDNPPFQLFLPVVLQKEAEVFAAIINATIHEQAIARDGALNGRSIFLVSTNRGDRLKVNFPEESRIYSFFLDGDEIQVESADSANARIIRLPPSAGQVSKVVLETTYGLDDASTRELFAPSLPEGVPVQRTWWRLWVPEDHQLLSYDRNFERPQYGENLKGIFKETSSSHPFHASSFDPRGTLFQFEKQGKAAVLQLGLHRKETVAIIVWLLVIAVGVALMKLRYFERFRVALGILALIAIWYLYQPLFSEAIVRHAAGPAVLILLLWSAQLVFWTFPKSMKAGRENFLASQQPASPPPAPPEESPDNSPNQDASPEETKEDEPESSNEDEKEEEK
jgi:hypothetical protein